MRGLARAAAWPLAARAQQPAAPTIGFLSSRSPGESATVVAAFRKGLAEAGFVEGRNVAIAFRWAEGRYAQLPGLAAELVGLNVAVLLSAGGTPSALAAKAATATIPVVFSGTPDPVGFGIVASLARPGGNVTGMATLTTELAAKAVEVLKDMVPSAVAMAYLVNPSNPSGEAEAALAREAARALGLELHLLSGEHRARPGERFRRFAQAARRRPHRSGRALLRQPARPARRALGHARDPDELSLARIRPGRRPHELRDGSPRQLSPGAASMSGAFSRARNQPTCRSMQPDEVRAGASTCKTAKALGLAVPPRLIERADEVIE